MSHLHVYMYLCSRRPILCIFSYSYLLMHMYLLDFEFITNFLISIYIADHCLYMYAYTTSLDRALVWLPEHAYWLYLTYSPGCFLTTLDHHVQIQEHGLCWPYCSWSEGIAEAWISRCHLDLSSQLFSWLSLETPLATREHLSAFDCVYPFVYHTFVYTGDVILYHTMW